MSEKDKYSELTPRRQEREKEKDALRKRFAENREDKVKEVRERRSGTIQDQEEKDLIAEEIAKATREAELAAEFKKTELEALRKTENLQKPLPPVTPERPDPDIPVFTGRSAANDYDHNMIWRNPPIIQPQMESFVPDYVPSTSGGGMSELQGAFYSMYQKDGDTYLMGGSVAGGNGGGGSVEDKKVIRKADTTPYSKAGKVLYLEVRCKATVEDAIMLPGCEVTAFSLKEGNNVPPNHTFSVTYEEGNLYYEIGRWTETKFLPSGVGNILASGCIGNFSLTRV